MPALKRFPSPVLLAFLLLAAASDAAAQCGEDMFEDNDSCAGALTVATPFNATGLVVYKTDSDFFAMTVPVGEEVRVDALFSHAAADIDLYLYDRGGSCGGLFTYLSRSVSSSDDEHITWRNNGPSPVEVVIKVEIYPGSIPVCNTYDFDVTVLPPFNACDPALLDDALEDNDSCGGAGALPIGLSHDLWASRDDEDFYEITLFGGETLEVDILFIDSTTDLDLFLYDANGPCGGGLGSGELVASFSQTDNERVVWSNTGGAPVDLVLHVDVWNFHSCNVYDLIATVSGGGIGSSYCTAVPNSSGAPASITARGTTSAAANDITLRGSQLPLSSFGFFLNSRTQGLTPGAGGSTGTLCLGGSIGRFDNDIVNSGSQGEFEVAIDLTSIPQPTGAVAALSGQTWYFQAWFRDSVGGMTTSNLTNGLEITLTP